MATAKIEQCRQRLALLEVGSPELCILAGCDLAGRTLLARELKQQIENFEKQIEIENTKEAIEYYEASYAAMNEYQRECSFVPDELETLRDILQELESEYKEQWTNGQR